jgi:hypothetical protein
VRDTLAAFVLDSGRGFVALNLDAWALGLECVDTFTTQEAACQVTVQIPSPEDNCQRPASGVKASLTTQNTNASLCFFRYSLPNHAFSHTEVFPGCVDSACFIVSARAPRYFGSTRPTCESAVRHSTNPLRIRQTTIESNLQAGSEGCAPTPSQYLALTESSFMSLKGLPSPSVGAFGIGSYVPIKR